MVIVSHAVAPSIKMVEQAFAKEAYSLCEAEGWALQWLLGFQLERSRQMNCLAEHESIETSYRKDVSQNMETVEKW